MFDKLENKNETIPQLLDGPQATVTKFCEWNHVTRVVYNSGVPFMRVVIPAKYDWQYSVM